MTRIEITKGIKKILTEVSSAKVEDIKLSDPLNKYVLPIASLSLDSIVSEKFGKVDLTDLQNSLYNSINTVNDLIDYILDAYKE